MPFSFKFFRRGHHEVARGAEATNRGPHQASGEKTLAQVCADVAESFLVEGGGGGHAQPDIGEMERLIRTQIPNDRIKALIVSGEILFLAQHAYQALAWPNLTERLGAVSEQRSIPATPLHNLASASRSRAKPPSNWKKFFSPEAVYSGGQLCSLVKSQAVFYQEEHAHDLLDALCNQVFRPTTKSRKTRMGLCDGVIKVMEDQQIFSVSFNGETYDSLFFQHLATDLALSRVHSKPIPDNKQELLRQLERVWGNNPDAKVFIFLGESYSRRDIDFWISHLKNDPNWKPPKSVNALAGEWDMAIEDQNKERGAQNVHMTAVQAYTFDLYDSLSKRIGKLPEMTVQQAAIEIKAAFQHQPNAALLKSGLEKVLLSIFRPAETGLRDSASHALVMMWQYIRSHPDPTVKESLEEALWSRLAEIGRHEWICSVGLLQRILDVPSGVDDSLNVFARRRQIEEDVIKIAAAVYELEMNSEEKIQVFQERVRQELIETLQLSEHEVTPAVMKQLAAFYD